jgi:glycine oxidase
VDNRISVDYIIVGQGLAGSAVAVQLIKSGKKVLVIDDPSQNKSSAVAAGLFNPVTGKNLVKTWLSDLIFPKLHNFYAEAEILTGSKFFYPIPLYRPFLNIEEQNEWMARSADEIYQPFIKSIYTTPYYQDINNEYGGVLLTQCGYVDTRQYLQNIRNYIASKCIFWESRFVDDDLVINAEEVEYRGVKALGIIFCQGVQSLSNKWFKKLPVIPLKGETLTVQFEGLKDVILNRGVYVVPGNIVNEFRVGSTYNLKDVSQEITPESRKELKEKLEELINIPFTIKEQEWGVRPTTQDRRPMLGRHPLYSNLFVFNGLGTKGVSLAPYFSEVLIRWLQNTDSLDKSVDVTRYKLLY